MQEVQLSPVDEQPRAHAPMSLTPATKAECELLVFVNSVTDLFGPDQAKFLTEIWMDALASMERMPSPASCDWQWVTQAASIRLAMRLIEMPNRNALF